MWIAGKLCAREEQEAESLAECGSVTIGGRSAAVLGRGEERDIPTAAPGGYLWRPRVGQRVLVIKGGPLNEERYIAGAVETENDVELADGEVCLFAGKGGAKLFLRNDGSVEIEGSLFINGALYVPPEE